MTKKINLHILLIVLILLALAAEISIPDSMLLSNIILLLPMLVTYALGTIFQVQLSNFILFFLGIFIDSLFGISLGISSLFLIVMSLLCVFHNQFVFLKSNLFINYLFFLPTSLVTLLFVAVLALMLSDYGFYIFKSVFELYLVSILLYPLLLVLFYFSNIILSYRQYGEE